ncbi:MAG: thiamine pyrophosphate-dependent dehydrogenase E1 component subunit alpha, partial [Anaerolineaceae bacterium]
ITPERASRLLAEIGRERAREMLLMMFTTRAFEEKAEELYALGKVHGTMHLSIGQEGVAAAASNCMRKGFDYLLNHHRGHGHCIFWGADIPRMMAEFLGKEEGYCRGRGGSMHIADVEHNNLGANGIVGGGLPIATGVGLSIKLRSSGQVCLVLFGDGATNEGAFHESLNLASVWSLPVVFLIENNQYGMSMAIDRSANVERLSMRACSYNIPGITVDGNDVLSLYDVLLPAVESARRGEGPSLIEAVTYRWRGHSKSDRQLYRTRDELKEWQARDPIPRFAAHLVAAGFLDEGEIDQFRQAGYDRIEAASAYADACTEPSVETIMEGVYA